MCLLLFDIQTVLNTMCGYGKQRLEEHLARHNIFTVGCLISIVQWTKNNLLVVAGLTGGLLLLEVTPPCTDAIWLRVLGCNKRFLHRWL